MVTQIRISGKQLGELALRDCCERCFWLKLRMGFKMPFQFFPGIFSSIDAYTKKVVQAWFDGHGAPPPWLNELGDLCRYLPTLHHSKFNTVLEPHSILLTGVPDGLFVHRDGSIVIVDFKTARFTPAQDALLPMYEVQLNAYALIAERLGLGRVAKLALVYCEPMTGEQEARERFREYGFDMGFAANVLSADPHTAELEPLFARTREAWDSPSRPAPGVGCENCFSLAKLLTLGA